jgi:hypothetical protein
VNSIVVLASIVVASLVLGFVLGVGVSRKRNSKAFENLAQLKKRYRQFYGWHEWYGTYDLETFDCGKSWYAMTTASDGRRIVRARAEEIYPGILSEPGLFAIETVQGDSSVAAKLITEDEVSEAFEALERQYKRKLSHDQLHKQRLCGRFSLGEITEYLRQGRA